MACGGCGRRRKAKVNKKDGVMGGYKYLTDGQIKARLEVYKKKYCNNCDKRYKCDYVMYTECRKNE